MPFRTIFASVVVGTALLAGAFFIHSLRPEREVRQPTEALVRASGKCAQCHREQTAAIVHEYERSAHAEEEVNCLECHGPAQGQASREHRGFVLAVELTAKNCARCHDEQYTEYLRSRHAAPAWAAVAGAADFEPEQVAHAETFHPGAVDRPPNELARLEGPAATRRGCEGCHAVGQPNADGSIGSCTDCHSRHWASLELARAPRTCGQCHMGPDHAQLEIYEESKHGVLYEAHRLGMDVGFGADELEPQDLPVPVCSTCHMGGIGGQEATHDTSVFLSYYLFAPISEKRPHFARNQARMKDLCNECHTSDHTDDYYEGAEAVLQTTNERVREAKAIFVSLREEKLLTPDHLDEPIEFLYFDLWHYHGRTAKHGAFMGGADYVQWHGNYPLLKGLVELEDEAASLRSAAAAADGDVIEEEDEETAAAAPGAPPDDGERGAP